MKKRTIFLSAILALVIYILYISNYLYGIPYFCLSIDKDVAFIEEISKKNSNTIVDGDDLFIIDLMNETSVKELSKNWDEGYRFLWIKTNPISITFWRKGDKYYLTKKLLDRKNARLHDSKFVLTINEKTTLTDKEWNEYISAIKQTCFWGQSRETKYEYGYYHGDRWLLEGYINGKYKFIERRYPKYPKNSVGGNFIAGCRRLLKISNINDSADK